MRLLYSIFPWLVNLLLSSNLIFAQKSDSSILIKVVNRKITTLAVKKVSSAIVDRDCSEVFDKLCYIGPLFWKKYRTQKDIQNIKGGDITFEVAINKNREDNTKVKLVNGKLIQNKKDFQIIWSFICDKLAGDTISIKKLSKDEQTYYWGITFFDVSEPLYIMENKKIKLLINQSPQSLKLLWIDDVSMINL